MTTMITAEQAARALVAACRITGVDPNRVFDKGTARAGQRGSVTGPYGARVMAAMGARSRLGLSPGRLAVVFRVVSADLTPSSGVKRGITAEHLLSVAEAMNGGDMPDRGEVIDLEPEPPEPSGPAPRPMKPDVRLVTNPVRAAVPSPVRPAAAMKAVTGDIRRWAAAYVRRGVKVAYLADLFDVDAEALQQALTGSGFQRAA
ncbi:hypothetical protein [Brevundimonas pondensis]|uniref:Uncharacterized protein n=1 Tax=Brevundimonas pondensis TaxID=2774189 RepID=A0ABX7SP80_9CAUL|nr:hypothetical protein [Brevundimonas pondensis]QTC88171.1 hypothetical protein IFE19_01830 [Brevundimonas pondensis]